MNRGAHTLKIGGSGNHNRNGQQPSWTDVLNFNFGSNTENTRDTGNTFANMLLGNYTSLSQSNGRFYGSFRFWGVEGYFQDSWKVNRKLTLEMWNSLGLSRTHLHGGRVSAELLRSGPLRCQPRRSHRYGSGTAQRQHHSQRRRSVQRHRAGGQLGFRRDSPSIAITTGVRALASPGISFGDGKTSIRGGGGIFHERIRQNVNNFDGLGNPPLLYTPSVYGGRVDEVRRR